MADSTTKAAVASAKNLKDVLVDQVKQNAVLSVKAGAIVSIATFGVLSTLLAVNAAVGVSQGIGDVVKTTARNPVV